MDLRMKNGIFKAKGANIYYETHGKGDNLLFLHAGIADCRMWDREFANMSKYFRTIRIDLPGYGFSEFTEGEYSYNEILKEVLVYLKAEKTHIVAASFGGKLALDFALSHPDKCQGMVLMAPAVSGWEDSQFLLNYYDEEDTLLQMKEYEEAAELNYHTWILRDRQENTIRKEIRDLVIDMQMESFMKDTPDIESRELEEENIISKLKNIKLPILVVIGDNDVDDYQRIANFILNEIGSAKKIVMENASYLANLEYPEKFESILLDFFRCF